jgi:flagellar basal-body rod protein FlgF
MDKALYIAMSGAKHNTLSQAVHANNLANVNTTGFRSDFAQARAMPVYYGDGHPTRAYAMAERPATDFKQGPLIETGRDLDVAIKGEGWIAVQDADGQEAYTRAGSLYVDSLGMLRTGNGLPVLGNGGPVAIPEAEKIEIGWDGTISIRSAGQGPETLANIDRIKLVEPDGRELEKREDGLIHKRDGNPEPASANVTLISGFVEGSNVNAVEAMTEMLTLNRQYELQVKLMSEVQRNSEVASRLLQIT